MIHQANEASGRSWAGRDFLLTAGATGWWVAHIWKGNHAEFSSSDITVFLVHCVALLLVEFLLLVIITRVLSARWSAPTNAVFCSFNFYTTVLVHSEQVAALSIVWTIALLLVCVLVFLLIFLLVQGHAPAFTAALSIVLVLTVMNLGRYAWKAGKQQEAVEAVELPSRLSFPSFTKTPNVYFIFFDAMIPQAIAQRFLGIKEELEYVRAIHDADMRMLENVFADHVPTLPSVSAFVALDLDYFEGLKDSVRYLQAIGAIPGPLYEIFKRNGYKTQLIYQDNYFGRPGLARLDHYGIIDERGVCRHADSKHALLGYCLPAVGKMWTRLLGTGSDRKRYPQMLFERISETAASPNPWVTISYIYRPGHTRKTFNSRNPDHWKAYAKRFEEVGVPKAANVLRDLLKTLDRVDPGAVVVVLGDHGAFLSRGQSNEQAIPPDSPLYGGGMFLDHHAVLGAIRPATFCPEYFQGPIGLSQIARDVIRCLASGQDSLPAEYRPYAKRYRMHAYE